MRNGVYWRRFMVQKRGFGYDTDKYQKILTDSLMEIAKVPETRQVMIPPEMRKTDRIDLGTEIILTDTGKGILIQPKPLFPPTTLKEVAGCLKVQGSPKTLEDMKSAMSTGIQEQWQDCS